jgi:hypothetical protein
MLSLIATYTFILNNTVVPRYTFSKKAGRSHPTQPLPYMQIMLPIPITITSIDNIEINGSVSRQGLPPVDKMKIAICVILSIPEITPHAGHQHLRLVLAPPKDSG